jgi:hypothetical protein
MVAKSKLVTHYPDNNYRHAICGTPTDGLHFTLNSEEVTCKTCQHELSPHLTHCYQGEYENSCKYCDDYICPAKKKQNKLETVINWKPTNPCKDCTLELREALGRENVYGFDNECQCEDQRKYYAKCQALETAFRWLTAWVENDDGNRRHRDINFSLIKEMQREMKTC